MNYYSENTIIFLKDKFVKSNESSASLYSQSLHYGYAVFEGIRSYKTRQNQVKIFKAKEHFQRLIDSCNAIGIPIEYSIAQLTEISYEVLKQNNQTNAYIRPLVFAPENMALAYNSSSNLLIATWEWNAYLGNNLVKISISPFTRPNPKAFKIQAKVSGHYVNSIIATQEAKSRNFDEALLLDENGNIAEASSANIFIEKNGKLFTPKGGFILEGITRATFIELAKNKGIEVIKKEITIDELKNADAAFLVGTAVEAVGISQVDEYSFPLDWNLSLGKMLLDDYKDLVTN